MSESYVRTIVRQSSFISNLKSKNILSSRVIYNVTAGDPLKVIRRCIKEFAEC